MKPKDYNSEQVIKEFFYDLFKEYDVKVDSLEVCDGKQTYYFEHGQKTNVKFIISILVNGVPSNMMFIYDKEEMCLIASGVFIKVNSHVSDAIEKFVYVKTMNKEHQNIKNYLSSIAGETVDQ